jgi:hypothetical protein
MSKILGKMQYILPSDLGDVSIINELVLEYDVEDVVRNRAISQGRALQFMNIGNQVDPNAPVSSSAIASSFKNSGEAL